MSDQSPARRPIYCPDCGEKLPPGQPRFCVACGEPTGWEPDDAEPAATGPTVRLSNARVEQEVIGGTMRLPSLGAVPPGLWDRDHPPGPDDVVAIYPPLRAVARGWSGHVGRGWTLAGTATEGTASVFLFRAPVVWTPAPGCGGGLELHCEVEATSHSTVEGRERRGFRFGLRRDGPMRVVSAVWRDERGQPHTLPQPQIQIMAPPRVPRMSDIAEAPVLLSASEAILWAGDSQAPGAYRLYLPQLQQEHTPVGRGATLIPLSERNSAGRPWWQRLIAGLMPARYRVRVANPLRCDLGDWPGRLGRIREEARALGLDLEPAIAAEWWLDRNGYDGVIFSGARGRYGADKVVIVFRRGQLAQIRD